MTKALSARTRLKRGFTLTEVAIVLGIIGLILGGIWIAAANVYTNMKTEDLMKELTFASGNMHLFKTTNVASAGDLTLTDSCGATPPCATNLLVQAGVFEGDLIVPGSYADGSAFGQGSIYETKYGFPIWTGIENAEVYANQSGNCPSSGCPAAATVVEIDLFDMPVSICTQVLMNIVNGHMNGLYSVTTTVNGWGPMTTSYGGQAQLPDTLPASAAAAACAPGASEYSYDNSAQSQIWMWFLPQ